MRRFNQKVLRILDGSPGALGGYQRGQSLVELLLVTPLLIIMVAGIIEIGWYANHVLILLEVTRVGARQATLFTGEYGYQVWDSEASLAPIAYKLSGGFTPAKTDLPPWTGTGFMAPTVPPVEAANFRSCDPITLGENKGFYNSVLCSMMNTLDPLTIKGRDPATADILAKRIRQEYSGGPLIGVESSGGRLWFTYDYNELFLYPDDIVVSVFSVQAINNATLDQKKAILTPAPGNPVPTIDANLYARTHDFGTRFPRGYQALVVGRYPTNANECNVTFTPSLAPTGNPGPDQLAIGESFMKRLLTIGAVDTDYQNRSWDSASSNMKAPGLPAGAFKNETYDGTKNTMMFRDPFEFYGNETTPIQNQIDGRYVELAGYDTGAEIQRGFVYTGQHVINGTIDPSTGRQLFCLGSEWSDQRVQDMMNSPSFLQKGIIKPPDDDPDASGDASNAWRDAGNRIIYDQWQERAKFLPSQGVVLVELFWRHDILLDFPLMTPIIRLMEGAGGPYNIVITVWAVFPLPGAEPNLNFGFPK